MIMKYIIICYVYGEYYQPMSAQIPPSHPPFLHRFQQIHWRHSLHVGQIQESLPLLGNNLEYPSTWSSAGEYSPIVESLCIEFFVLLMSMSLLYFAGFPYLVACAVHHQLWRLAFYVVHLSSHLAHSWVDSGSSPHCCHDSVHHWALLHPREWRTGNYMSFIQTVWVMFLITSRQC